MARNDWLQEKLRPRRGQSGRITELSPRSADELALVHSEIGSPYGTDDLSFSETAERSAQRSLSPASSPRWWQAKVSSPLGVEGHPWNSPPKEEVQLAAIARACFSENSKMLESGELWSRGGEKSPPRGARMPRQS